MEMWEITYALRCHRAEEARRRRQAAVNDAGSPRIQKPRFNTWGVIPSQSEQPTPSLCQRLGHAIIATWLFIRSFWTAFCMSSGFLGLLLLIVGVMAKCWALAASGFGLMLFFIVAMEAIFD